MQSRPNFDLNHLSIALVIIVLLLFSVLKYWFDAVDKGMLPTEGNILVSSIKGMFYSQNLKYYPRGYILFIYL